RHPARAPRSDERGSADRHDADRRNSRAGTTRDQRAARGRADAGRDRGRDAHGGARRDAAAPADRERLRHRAGAHPAGAGRAHDGDRLQRAPPSAARRRGDRTMSGGRQRTVCFVVPSLAGGGAERVAVQVLNALDGGRWNRWLYLFERRGPYLADVASSVRIESSAATSRIGRWRQLRRFFRIVRPDVVVVFLSYFSVLT